MHTQASRPARRLPSATRHSERTCSGHSRRRGRGGCAAGRRLRHRQQQRVLAAELELHDAPALRAQPGRPLAGRAAC